MQTITDNDASVIVELQNRVILLTFNPKIELKVIDGLVRLEMHCVSLVDTCMQTNYVSTFSWRKNK